MQIKAQTNRRQFLTRGFALVGLLPLAWASRGFSQSKCSKKVDLKNNKMAAGIGYKPKFDLKKDKDLVNADGTGKYCWTCILYTAEPDVTAPEKSKQGPCKLMLSLEDCVVEAKGGCRSWAENAAMKGKKFVG